MLKNAHARNHNSERTILLSHPLARKRAANQQKEQMETEKTLKWLLSLRLTKFEYGFCLGLLEHNPTPAQQATLDKIKNRYAHVWAEKEINEHTEQPAAS
jgi:hypothetical protein